MKYNCPKCGEPVKRSYNRTAQVAGGLLGVLIYSAFGPFNCPKCGKIKQDEFPEETRSKIKSGNMIRGIIALAIIFLLIWLAVSVD